MVLSEDVPEQIFTQKSFVSSVWGEAVKCVFFLILSELMFLCKFLMTLGNFLAK